ncbi:MAG: 3-phosphoshikimate 1-carboxyvinyltransferase, partial [Fibrobacterota bacterium]
MNFKVTQSVLSGKLDVPASKSHTLRAAVIAALAKGSSTIRNPLTSADTLACIEALKLLGATEEQGADWTITGFEGRPRVPERVIDVKNSGTTINFLSAVAALADGEIELTGDESIQKRPMQPLLSALKMLGAARAESKENNHCPPVIIRGRLFGGSATVEGVSSQFVSALLLTAPLLRKQTELKVVRLYERPYVDMTLAWLKKMGIEVGKLGRNNFTIPGGQAYYGFATSIPADFSSAAFPLIGALITGGDVLLTGLDMTDTQGDKRLFELVQEMGASVIREEGGLRVKPGESLEGVKIDLNDMPDALPALAVLGCFTDDEMELTHVTQARIKETDRITVMCQELKKMGADIEETQDGLIICKSELKGAEVDGHGDHRVVMALAMAGLAAEG